MQLTDEIVVVTGAPAGIDRAAVDAFAKDGARVVDADLAWGPFEDLVISLEPRAWPVEAYRTCPEAIPPMLERGGGAIVGRSTF